VDKRKIEIEYKYRNSCFCAQRQGNLNHARATGMTDWSRNSHFKRCS